MAKIRWTAEAERWLREIYNYVREDKPEAAARLIEAIFQKAQLLRDYPQVGHRYLPRADREIRVLLHGHYRIAYLIKPDGNIDILGVFHGALEIERYLE